MRQGAKRRKTCDWQREGRNKKQEEKATSDYSLVMWTAQELRPLGVAGRLHAPEQRVSFVPMKTISPAYILACLYRFPQYQRSTEAMDTHPTSHSGESIIQPAYHGRRRNFGIGTRKLLQLRKGSPYPDCSPHARNICPSSIIQHRLPAVLLGSGGGPWGSNRHLQRAVTRQGREHGGRRSPLQTEGYD